MKCASVPELMHPEKRKVHFQTNETREHIKRALNIDDSSLSCMRTNISRRTQMVQAVIISGGERLFLTERPWSDIFSVIQEFNKSENQLLD